MSVGAGDSGRREIRMERRMAIHLTSFTDGPEPRTEAVAPTRGLDASPPSNAESHDDLENLAQSEIMLRTAIESLSPDADEIQARLDREKNGDASAASRQLGFRLAVVVAVLVFLILALDLLLAGA